jgi:signal recognition particle receptor subunit beta
VDFGTMAISGHRLHLFGTPGQDRFDFMWDILCEGALGLVLLVAGDRPQDFVHARRIYDHITSQIALPTVLGVTRQDLPKVWRPQDVADFFGLTPDLALGLDARERNSCLPLLQRLFAIVSTGFGHQPVA